MQHNGKPDVEKLEQNGWQALATDQATARTYYDSLLAEEAVMLFPGGMLVKGKEAILASIDSQPWHSFELSEVQVIGVNEGVKVIIYKVAAQHEGNHVYEALISSTYVWREDSWKLILHQQTPF